MSSTTNIGTKHLPGLHHVTAITGDAQANLDFYTGVLGLRLVKITVNFDDPGAYHLYYGDGLGSPGTILTFFAWPGSSRGRSGAGQVTATAYAVPAAALDYWRQRLDAHGVGVSDAGERFGEPVLRFVDPDGISLELIGVADDARAGWGGNGVSEEQAIRGFHGVTVSLRETDDTDALLRVPLGFAPVGEMTDPTGEQRTRYLAADGAPANVLDVLHTPSLPYGQSAAGTVHHIAWRTPDDAAQGEWLRTLTAARLRVTPVQDRQYFHSIYFREPGGVLFEIATDAPGFAIDETPETLGTALRLPPQYEPMRERIAASLPPLRLPTQT